MKNFLVTFSHSQLVTKRIVATVFATLGSVIVAVALWSYFSRRISTDDAYVKADILPVTAPDDGRVLNVAVGENAPVRAGQILVIFEQSDLEIEVHALEETERASLASQEEASARFGQANSTVSMRIEEAKKAQAIAENAKLKLNRSTSLHSRGLVADAGLEVARIDAASADTDIEIAKAAIQNAKYAASEASAALNRTVADGEKARSDSESAKLRLSRTVVRSPVNGVVGGLSLRTGAYVKRGDMLMRIVPSQLPYIEANFRESQIRQLRRGQVAKVVLDAFPRIGFLAQLESFSPATGAEFARLPVEQSSGNFTKIAQRVPVRLRILEGSRIPPDSIRPGMSARVTVPLDQAQPQTIQ